MNYQIGKFLETAAFIVGLLLTMVVLISLGTVIYFEPTLSSKATIINNKETGLTLLDDSGKPFFEFYQAKNIQYVNLSQISNYVKNAAVASEDRNFYHHAGISTRGIARAALYDIETGTFGFGGSTITQQLVKNTLLTSEKSFSRKVKEALLAEEIEHKYSKDEILEMYLNSVYFGRGAFGIEEAANTYFGKDASNLNLAESSYLVGLLPSPSTLAEDQSGALAHQKIVLNDLQENGYITESDYEKTLNSKLQFKTISEDINTQAPHFALMVRDALIQKYGEEVITRSGFRVRTTLNSSWQNTAQDAVKSGVERLAGDNVSNGAAVVMDPKTGEVKALVGSADWDNTSNGRVNMATTPRQPGSSFKPIVYATAFENELITPATVLEDVPKTFKLPDCEVNCDYKPHDYDGHWRGPVLVRRALANSLNVPAVEVMEKVGVQEALNKASELGIDTLKDTQNYNLSLVLGAGEVPLIEMVHAYSSFAGGGTLHDTKLYTEITDKNGKNVYEAQDNPTNPWQPDVAFLISSILSDNRARAEEFGSALTISRPAAVKTGTTENYRDAWTIGYTPDLVVGVWVGNNDNVPMDNVAGSLGAAPIWRELMTSLSSGMAIKKFSQPDNISEVAICPSTGGRISSSTSSARMEYFISGTEPTQSCGDIELPNIAVATSSAQTDENFVPGVGGGPPQDTPAAQ